MFIRQRRLSFPLNLTSKLYKKEMRFQKKKFKSPNISTKVCQMCETLKDKIKDLNKSLERFTNDKRT